MLKITAETEKKSGQQSGFRALWGMIEEQKLRRSLSEKES